MLIFVSQLSSKSVTFQYINDETVLENVERMKIIQNIIDKICTNNYIIQK